MADKKILLTGCSFINEFNVDNDKIKIFGFPGAGNSLIAEKTLSELATGKYDRVFVSWSGINRIDVPVGESLGYVIDQGYKFKTHIGKSFWYASGGLGASGQSKNCPKAIRGMFDAFYKFANARYLTDQGLTGVLKVQSYLQAKKIQHKMSFIYDIHKRDQHWDHALGRVDKQSHVYQLIDWDNIQITNTPHEWAKQHNFLCDDKFHPTVDAMKEWIRQNFNLDLDNLRL
jgi:hypothetical protein